MTRRLTLIFSLFVLAVSGCAHLKYLDPFDGYNGKPKIVESSTYSVSGDQEKLAYKFYYHYDDQGRRQFHSAFKSDGSPSTGGTTYIYDKKGNILQSTRLNRDSTINSQVTFRYNRKGQEVLKEIVDGRGKTVTRTNYNKKDRTATVISLTNDTIFFDHAILQYDRHWKRVNEIRSYNKDGRLRNRIEKHYNATGVETGNQWFDSTNKLYSISKWELDQHNNATIAYGYAVKDGDTSIPRITRFEYQYDSQGNILYKAIISEGKKSWVTRNVYHY